MGRLIVTASPSGGGKTTLNRKLLENQENIIISISYTTRPPRAGDQEGIDYFFIDEGEFKDKIKAGDFVEYAKVHEHYYGTSISKLKQYMDQGLDIILEIDVQGATQIKKQYPDSCLVFIMPPSFEVLSNRLKSRKTDSQEQINIRLENAKKELAQANNYDYIVVNDDLGVALNDFKCIINNAPDSQKLKVENRQEFLDTFLFDMRKA